VYADARTDARRRVRAPRRLRCSGALQPRHGAAVRDRHKPPRPRRAAVRRARLRQEPSVARKPGALCLRDTHRPRRAGPAGHIAHPQRRRVGLWLRLPLLAGAAAERSGSSDRGGGCCADARARRVPHPVNENCTAACQSLTCRRDSGGAWGLAALLPAGRVLHRCVGIAVASRSAPMAGAEMYCGHAGAAALSAALPLPQLVLRIMQEWRRQRLLSSVTSIVS
jgi:hypothetical protein